MEENKIKSRFRNAWNAFFNKDPTEETAAYGSSFFYSSGSSYRPDRIRMSRGNERSIITAVFNRIALDVASNDIMHVKLDDNNRYVETLNTDFNNCLTLEANLDQTSRVFIQDVVMSMFDEGCVAIVPVDTKGENPKYSDSYDILTMRTAKILKWYPDKVDLEIYNEVVGKRDNVTLPKKMVAIIENPFYAIMNEPNSTLQRLIRKLNLMDMLDEKNCSGKLDLIIQLPYVVKTESKKAQAEQRRSDIERQLTGSKYGIAYTDGTERITQLNRPVENNLLTQVESLTSMLYSQLGITQAILDGTADDKAMLNYQNRVVEPILSAIVDEMERKFLSKTARSQHQSIKFFRDAFKLIPLTELAEYADKLTRNEIMTSNEFRQAIGMKASEDPRADVLMNKNLSQSKEEIAALQNEGRKEMEGEFQNE